MKFVEFRIHATATYGLVLRRRTVRIRLISNVARLETETQAVCILSEFSAAILTGATVKQNLSAAEQVTMAPAYPRTTYAAFVRDMRSAGSHADLSGSYMVSRHRR